MGNLVSKSSLREKNDVIINWFLKEIQHMSDGTLYSSPVSNKFLNFEKKERRHTIQSHSFFSKKKYKEFFRKCQKEELLEHAHLLYIGLIYYEALLHTLGLVHICPCAFCPIFSIRTPIEVQKSSFEALKEANKFSKEFFIAKNISYPFQLYIDKCIMY